MPRLAAPDPLSEAIGRRVRGLRTALGLTQERLAFESGSIAKGHLSDLEKGLLRPTVHTLKGVADLRHPLRFRRDSRRCTRGHGSHVRLHEDLHSASLAQA